MNKKLFSNGKMFIRELKISDVSKKYIGWLNDENTNIYILSKNISNIQKKSN